MTAERSAWTAGAVAFGATPAAPATPDTTLASRGSGIVGAKANGRFVDAVMSAGRRLIAFASTATNLSPDDRDPGPHIYLRDRRKNTTVLSSRAGAAGANGDRPSNQPAISADGRFVAFAANHDPYVRELAARAERPHPARSNPRSPLMPNRIVCTLALIALIRSPRRRDPAATAAQPSARPQAARVSARAALVSRLGRLHGTWKGATLPDPVTTCSRRSGRCTATPRCA